MRYSTNQRPRSAYLTDRTHDWDIKLVEFVKARRSMPFEWGVNDCLTFANEAVKAQRGYGFGDEFLGGYSTVKGALEAYSSWLEASGCSNIVEGLDKQLDRAVGLPPRGSVVAMPSDDDAVFPYSFGVMVSQYAAFVTKEGLIMVVPDDSFLAWRVS